MNTLTRLAISNDKENKTRSILVIVSVILTTLLLTVILTYGYGLVKFNKATAGDMYGHYYGYMKEIGEEQLQNMRHHSAFTDIGILAQTGMVENADYDIALYYADETCRELMNTEKVFAEGHYPETEQEIAAIPMFFEALGYKDAKIGERIVISCRSGLDRKFEEKEFVISGLLYQKQTDIEMTAFMAYISGEFYESFVPEEEQYVNAYFRLADSVPITIDNREAVLKELAKECGISENLVRDNSMYLFWELEPGTETITGCAFIACVVILFSVLVIYNIFQVGIIQKIQEYGKLKALGMTRKQLKKVVFREGMLLAVIGVPIGLAAGYITAAISFESIVMEATGAINSNIEKISLFSVPILLGAAILSFAAVYFALKKPMRITAAISPIEAIRYQESTGKRTQKKKRGKRTADNTKQKTGRGLRRGRKEVSVVSMTLANLSANKKRTTMTIVTMGLSCVLFVVMANVVGNMDEEYEARREVAHGKFLLSVDYSLNDSAYPENNLSNIMKQNPLSAEAAERIRNIDGVTEVKTRELLSAVLNGKEAAIGVLSREDFQKEDAKRGTVDYDKASEENAVIFGYDYWLEEEGYALGETLSFTVEKENEKGVLDMPVSGTFSSADNSWNITQDTCEKLGLSGAAYGYIWVDCRAEDEEAVGNALRDMFAGTEHVEIKTYENSLKIAQESTKLVKFMVYSFLLIIGLISFMNMANTMIISIITRKQEFGVLQAVGMTNGQLNRSLQLEGLFFTAGTLLVSMAVGIPLGYAAFLYGIDNGIFGLHVYHFPVWELIFMVAALSVLQLILSFLLSRNVKRESIMERIRYQG